MRVILTHEQADFDALASLLAAHLLDEGARPVLPRRLNRNARAFLTLYGADLSFVDPRDLTGEAIEAVTLADTQSLITLKGMSEKTRVRVIDHHPRRAGLPDDWEVRVEEVGATTTLLVEALQERDAGLTTLPATLFLLGIYEDTGALTYAHTSARDARAAAYLLEQGASLKLAAEFLNPPLSPAQRALYDLLLARSRTHAIHGHRVITACAPAPDMSEEISSLAHKLRDELDPDALFVLVLTGEGVRLVARSTSDQIDVAAVAARFNGGGHDRASAALVRPPEGQPCDVDFLERTCQALLEALPSFVQPSVTVAAIMSRRPSLVPPTMTAQEAARLMQRYGYEGFPVVQDGRVIGLLTRRAVDRALAHKLNLPAASLMEAGEVAVRPDDSIQHVQTRMTDSGWGQLPVVDERGEVIGIVTRTDVLKTLVPPAARPTGANLAARIEAALPPERLEVVRRVADAAASQRAALYVVGGFVRDLLLERPSLDFDLVVEGDAIALGKALARKHGGRITTHARFGTAKWFPKPQAGMPEFIDLISARTEFYEQPGTLPTVERGSIKLDLHRRDFTINTLALRLDGRHYGELHDYYGGTGDLERGLVRVLHSLSFVDDPTRMLRAVRFEQRFGFEIEPRTLQLMDEARPLLERLSGERVRHELDLILDEPHAAQMLARLAGLNLLAAIHPALPWDRAAAKRLQALEAPVPAEWRFHFRGLSERRALGYLLWLQGLPPVTIAALGRRLRFSAALMRAIRSAAALLADLPALEDARPSAWVARLEDVPPAAVYAVYLNARGAARKSLGQYALKWRQVHPHTDGNSLRKLGLEPGPRFQVILRRLRDAWLDGEIKSQQGEQALLASLLKK